MLGGVLYNGKPARGNNRVTSGQRRLIVAVTGPAGGGVLVLGRRVCQAVHQQVVQDTATSVLGEQVAPGCVGGYDGTQYLLRHLEGLGPAGGGQLVLRNHRSVPHGGGTGGGKQGQEQCQQ